MQSVRHGDSQQNRREDRDAERLERKAEIPEGGGPRESNGQLDRRVLKRDGFAAAAAARAQR
jgi:hypothetical protein